MRKPHSNARKLRKAMPDAERQLWARIRRKQLGGFRFRRQHTIGSYVADFACIKARLVIELDGDQHTKGAALAYDAKRNAFMAGEGWEVLRVWNNDVYGNIDGVLEMILEAAERSVRHLNAQSCEDDDH